MDLSPVIVEFVGAFAGGFAAGMFRRKKLARSVAREVVSEHERTCLIRNYPHVTPAYGYPLNHKEP